MDNLSRQFGLIIAYLLPGFIALAGIAPLVPAVAGWLQPATQIIGIAPPLYALMAATAAGMVVSCCRWLVIDQLLYFTGLPQSISNYRVLGERIVALNYLVENHYRYYQFYANTLIAILFAYGINRLLKTSSLLGLGTDLGVLTLCAVLLAGSRDALSKYRQRAGQLAGPVAEKDTTGDDMTNGIDHNQGKGDEPSTPQKPKADKPETTPKPKQEKVKEGQAAK